MEVETAPTSTVDAFSDPAVASWPAPEEWPADDAPARAWAAWYRDRLGWVVLPMPSDEDVAEYAASLLRTAVADYADEHGGAEPDEETQALLWDDAREIAARGRKGALGWIRREKYQTATDVTDADLDRWWTTGKRPTGARRGAERRGICILTCRSGRGFPVCLVDTDPRHGGDPLGEWATAEGPRATTPGIDREDPDAPANPGVHTYFLAIGGERSSQNSLAPGVDVIAWGGTPVSVPAGYAATPGRCWVSKDAPRPAPEALRAVPRSTRKMAPPRVDGAARAGAGATTGRVRERDAGDDDEDFGLGRVANVIASEAGKAERNYGAACIVGMLARPFACPPDVVRACLELLAESLAGDDRGITVADREMLDRWRHALTRGPRDVEFAQEVLATWIHCRDVNQKRWREAKTHDVARSIWKTCERREEGQAGAEDYGVGGPLGHIPAGAPRGVRLTFAEPPAALAADVSEERVAVASPVPPSSAPPSPAVPSTSPAVDIFNPPALPISDATSMPPAVQVPAWRGGIDPRTFVRGLGEFYTPDALARDLVRRPVAVDDVMPLMDFASGRLADRPGYGWGGPLDLALGGLSPGDVRFLAAAGAGAGKTWFECWLANGLALATACRILGYKGYEDRPIVLPIWVSEMPKRGELLWRLAGAFCGFDYAAIAWGERAARAPGIVAHARDLGGAWSPEDVVRRARSHLHQHIERPAARDDSPLGLAYHRLIKVIDLAALPPARGRYGAAAIDHQSGPALVDHVADAVQFYREDLAATLGVSASDVIALVMVDPGQRFAGHGPESRALIDAFFSAIVRVLAGEMECSVIGTLDTTKAAVLGIDVDGFLGGDADQLAAQMAAGSQAIMHNADVIGLCAEKVDPSSPTPLITTQWARVLKGRSGGVMPEAYPFEWEKSLGRFRPRPAEALRPRPQGPDGAHGRGHHGTGHRRGDDHAGPPPQPLGQRPAARLHHPMPAERRSRMPGETDD